MSKNYDNWERLVTAVVRRERDRQIALAHSRDPSISSASSSLDLSFSYASRVGHHQSLVFRERNESPMDLSGLKQMLPDKQKVVWISSSMFFPDRSWKNCFLLGAGARNLVMSYVIGPEHKSHLDSRYSELAKLLDSWNQHIRAGIETSKLSPETLYASYLVYGFTEKRAKPHVLKSTITIYYGDAYCYLKKQNQIVKFEASSCRSDGWLETVVGEFYLDLETMGKVIVELRETGERCFSGLIVQGIEFRPLQI